MTVAGLARHSLVACGILILLWSGLEDSDSLAVTLLGLTLALGVTALLWSRIKNSKLAWILAGGTCGALASLLTTGLMLFKDLRHMHAFPDYPPGMLLAMLERLPIWALAGGLAGLGCGILLAVRAGRKTYPLGPPEASGREVSASLRKDTEMQRES